MTDQTTKPRRNRTAQILSSILFIAAIGFAAGAGYVWYTDEESPAAPRTPPPAENAAQIDLAQVLRVLTDTNDDWDYGRNPVAAHANQLSAPGQHLKLGDVSLFVFIFTGPSGEERVAAREAASEQMNLETMELTTTSGDVINANGEQLYMAEGSNVITILVGGDQELADQVADAIAELP